MRNRLKMSFSYCRTHVKLIFAFIAFSITSCSVYRRDLYYKYNTAPIYGLKQAEITHGQLETDLEMIGEVTASYSMSVKDNNLQEGSYVVDDDFLLKLKSEKMVQSYAQAKACVLYMALEEVGCDIILAPIYKLEVKGDSEYSYDGKTYYPTYGSEISYTISVKGFGANIKGIRQIKSK